MSESQRWLLWAQIPSIHLSYQLSHTEEPGACPRGLGCQTHHRAQSHTCSSQGYGQFRDQPTTHVFGLWEFPEETQPPPKRWKVDSHYGRRHQDRVSSTVMEDSGRRWHYHNLLSCPSILFTLWFVSRDGDIIVVVFFLSLIVFPIRHFNTVCALLTRAGRWGSDAVSSTRWPPSDLRRPSKPS